MAIIASILPLVIFFMMPETIIRLILVGGVSILSAVIVIYTIGMEQTERNFIKEKILFPYIHLKWTHWQSGF